MPSAQQLSGKVRRALHRRYAAPAYALLEEVADGTGARARRRADALVIGCWPSRGLTIEGVEIKVARSDWLRELKKPRKSEAVQRYCDHWWIAAPSGVVDPDELPRTWGLLELQKGGKLRVRVAAPALDPQPLDRSLLASLARAMHEGVQSAEQRVKANLPGKDEYDKGYQAGEAFGRKVAEAELRGQLRQGQSALDTLKNFVEATGIPLNSWNGRHLGRAMRNVVAAATYRPLKKDYARLLSLLESRVPILKAELRAIEEAEAFLTVDDEAWQERLHAGSAHPGYEYYSGPERPKGDDWEPNDPFDWALHPHVPKHHDSHWRRKRTDA